MRMIPKIRPHGVDLVRPKPVLELAPSRLRVSVFSGSRVPRHSFPCRLSPRRHHRSQRDSALLDGTSLHRTPTHPSTQLVAKPNRPRAHLVASSQQVTSERGSTMHHSKSNHIGAGQNNTQLGGKSSQPKAKHSTPNHSSSPDQVRPRRANSARDIAFLGVTTCQLGTLRYNPRRHVTTYNITSRRQTAALHETPLQISLLDANATHTTPCQFIALRSSTPAHVKTKRLIPFLGVNSSRLKSASVLDGNAKHRVPHHNSTPAHCMPVQSTTRRQDSFTAQVTSRSQVR
jgi:hypothetical protein